MSEHSPYGLRLIPSTELVEMQEKVRELKACLRYVLYARLPLGDKVSDHLPKHWHQRSAEALDKP